MSQRTVAVVSNTSWFIYNFHLTLLDMLQQKGYRVVVIAPKDAYSQRFESLRMTYREISMNNKGTSPVEDARLLYDFYRIYKDIAPDVILQYTIKPNIYGSMAAGMLKIPVISTVTGLGTVFLNDSFSSSIAKMLYRMALRFPRKVFFLNSADRELFLHAGLVKKERAALIPGSGIDTERFRPRVKSGKGKEVFSFLLIARLLKDKGIEEYVNAAGILMHEYGEGSKVVCRILGAFYPGNPTAVTQEEMQKWESEGAVQYLGTSDDVPSVIAGADCVVLPSYREGISQVLLEAASMAKPLIASDVPGCREVVEEGVNGFLCEAKNARSLALQMQKMLALDLESREAMGREGRKKVQEQFEEHVVNAIYMDIIEDMLE